MLYKVRNLEERFACAISPNLKNQSLMKLRNPMLCCVKRQLMHGHCQWLRPMSSLPVKAREKCVCVCAFVCLFVCMRV